MYRNDDGSGWRRAGAGLGALAIQGAFISVLVWGLSAQRSVDGGPVLPEVAAFDVSRPTPPPPEPEPEQARDPEPEPPAPEGRRGKALPVEAPEVAIPLAPAPAATRAGVGSDASDGAGERGLGSGAGGNGEGSGGGGGGVGTAAQRIAGRLSDRDYPRAAEAERMAGTVGISFRVRTDGRVDRCTVARSSGHALLDDLTCRLFTQRYRFRPATDPQGQPIETTLQTSFTWGTRRR